MSAETADHLGELFVVGFEGIEPTPELAGLIRDWGVGGILLYGKNCRDPYQVLRLTRELQAIARSGGRESPLLVAVDQEMGRVTRLREGMTLFPPMGELGRIGDPALVEEVAQALSRELAAVGVNWNLAPVADVRGGGADPIGDRSFGHDPKIVASLVRAFVRGSLAEGMLCCAKHFPGHGSADADSHGALPLCRSSREQIRRLDLPPFREALEEGVPSLMTAHVLYPALDAEAPATISKRIVGELLRGELAYGGALVSDDLEMAALSRSRTLSEGALAALAAGVDMLIVSGMLLPARDVAGIILSLRRALAEGELSEERAESALKSARGLSRRAAPPPQGEAEARALLRCRPHLALAAEVEGRLG